jgi:uncharacterized protein YeaO (DUF488 family)
MKLQVSTYRIGSPRAKSEGLRIGTARFLPRGVRKTDYSKHDFFDVWLPLVAPSRELLKSFTSGKKSAAQFFRAYRAEMREPAARHLLELLAKVAQRTPISVGCYCEDETRCHRSVLIELIRKAVSDA